MTVEIKIPTKAEILSKGIPLQIAVENESWLQDQLGDYAKLSGVYIHHKDGQILYVGQTSKGTQWGQFHVRLRRECQLKAAFNSPLFQLLANNSVGLMTTMYHFDEVREMFSNSLLDLTFERMTLILEQVMIAAYKPTGNKK